MRVGEVISEILNGSFNIQTKRDLLEDESIEEEEKVTKEMLKKKQIEHGLVSFNSTSSKEWSDFNVHKAFKSVINAGYLFKYERRR